VALVVGNNLNPSTSLDTVHVRKLNCSHATSQPFGSPTTHPTQE